MCCCNSTIDSDQFSIESADDPGRPISSLQEVHDGREIKLIYFDLYGRAEAIRMLLAYARVKFEDVRVDMEQWEELKSKYPGMQLPIMEIDGVVYNQSKEILRTLGVSFGYYPTQPMAAYEADWVVATIDDFS